MSSDQNELTVRLKPKRDLTALVSYTFRFQYAFTEDEICPAEGMPQGEFEPTEQALATLGRDLAEQLGELYSVYNHSFDEPSTLGISEDTENESDFFEDVRPPKTGTNIVIPSPDHPRTVMYPNIFPVLCEFFTENGMSFHVADENGNIVFFLSVSLEDCPAVLNARWEFSCEPTEDERLLFTLVVSDKPDDPLNVPFVFDAFKPQHAHEMVCVIEQNKLPFYVLTVAKGQLYFFDRRMVELNNEFREFAAWHIRQELKMKSSGETFVFEEELP